MNCNTQNEKIKSISEKTLIVGIDIGSETHYARAFDWRGYEYSKKAFEFSNSEEGFISFMRWIEEIVDKEEKETVSSVDSALYDIYLQACGNNNIAVIKEIRSITGRGLKEAKDLAESLPACLKKGCPAEETDAIKKQFDACGAVVKIVAHGSKPEPQAVVKFTGFYCNNCSGEFDSDSEINCCCPTCNNKGIALRKMEFTNFTRTLEDCKYLVEHGTDLNLLWDSVVTWGVNEDSYEEIESDYEEYIRIAEYLLSKGADINYRNCPGYMNALEAAEEFGSDEMIKFLIEHGAKH